MTAWYFWGFQFNVFYNNDSSDWE